VTPRSAGESDPEATPRCGAAASTDPRLDVALRAAAADALEALDGDTPPDPHTPAARPDLALVFVSAGYGAEIRPVCEGLADLVGARSVLGSTAEGVLAGLREYEREPAVVVWLARLPGASVIPFALEYGQTPDGGLFTGWPDELVGGWPAHASVLLLADPFSFPVDGFIRRLEDDRPGVPIVGGMASGGMQPGSNTLVVGPRTYDMGAVGVVIGGGVRLRPVVSQGCRPIGRPLVITKSEENLIIELGGRPALERLREIYADLDPTDRDLVRTSLHVGRAASEYRDRFGPGDFLVRTVAGADPESGVIAVGDLVRTGQTVQFHVRDGRSAHEDLRRLLDREREQGAAPAGAVVFSCNGRGTRLFAEADHDARVLQECLGPLPAAGFFAQGEIGPIGDRTFLHGFTAAIALVERAG
jgi:small ligand-binding sensory domain FIST